MSTRFTNAGITLRSSSSASPPKRRASGSGEPSRRISELLVGLARRVHADVAEGGRRQKPPHRVERLRLDRALPDALGLVSARVLLGRPLPYALETCRVEVEDAFHRLGVGGAQALVPVVAVPPARKPAVVGDVARRLLQIGGEAAALEDLREHVRGPLTGEMRPAQLGDRVVAELQEHSFIQRPRPARLRNKSRPPASRRSGSRRPRSPFSPCPVNSSRYRRRSVPP